MKKVILLFALGLLIVGTGTAQEMTAVDTVNRVDASGKKQGYWAKEHLHGVVRYEGFFKDDVPVGTFKYYYQDGKPQSIIAYSQQDPAFSSVRHFHQSTGNVMAEGFYRNQQKDSVWKIFDLDGKKVALESYRLGKKNGLWENYYLDDRVVERRYFIDNLEQGEYKRYFRDGVLKYEANYVDGNPDGTVKTYFPDGVVKSIGKYNSAVKHGKWIYYGVDGAVRVEETWVRGDLVRQAVDGVEVEPGSSMYSQPDSVMVKERVISGDELNEIKDEWGE